MAEYLDQLIKDYILDKNVAVPDWYKVSWPAKGLAAQEKAAHELLNKMILEIEESSIIEEVEEEREII